MGREHIPEELRLLPQWVICGADKRPLSPKDHTPASVIDPSTWGTFEDACLAIDGLTNYHVGFVFTTEDPYIGIDLDQPRNEVDAARHQKILEHFDTYIERSQSGNGYHILCRGAIPEGARRDKVEMYPHSRFFIMTGMVYRDSPINDCQELIDILYREIKHTASSAQPVDGEEVATDAEIVAMAMRAANAEKFNLLCQGDISHYPSQSEADLALLSILAFYSRSNEQVKRLFRMSELGKRDKAVKNDTYLNYAVKRIRANEPQFLNLETVQAQAQAALSAIPGKETPRPVTFPKGLIGTIAEYILHQAVRPVPEVALAGAIAYFAGITGRAYNISGTGLNQYLLVLAKTGSGKEGAMTGIERLTTAIRPHIPMVDGFIGPAAFASGQGLIKVLDQHPCFVSVLGEFGLTLQQLSDPRANSATTMLKKVILDLYTKSGKDNVLRSTVYSDAEKNTKIIQAPAVTILGESTPEAFFDGISSSHISEGLIPRFLVLEYTGGRPERNGKGDSTPDPDLIKALCAVVTQSLTMQANRAHYDIPLEPKAQTLLDEFDRECDRHLNHQGSEVEAQLWNRAHLKALKLAGLMAVGLDHKNPVVTPECARWAIHMVAEDARNMLRHFSEGDVGEGDAKQIFEIRKLVERFLKGGPDSLKNSGATTKMIKDGVIPLAYFLRRTAGLAAFRKVGASFHCRKALEVLVAAGVLNEVQQAQMTQDYGSRMTAYTVGSAWGV